MEQHINEEAEAINERALVVLSTCKDLVPFEAITTMAETDWRNDETLSEEERELRAELEEMESMLTSINEIMVKFSNDLRTDPGVNRRFIALEEMEAEQLEADAVLEDAQAEIKRLRSQIERLRTGRSEEAAGEDSNFYYEDEDSEEDRQRIKMEVEALRHMEVSESDIRKHVQNLRKSFQIIRERQAQAEQDQNTFENATRNRRRICKKLYTKISARTHPDRTSDSDLNTLFLRAVNLYNKLDLDGLTILWNALQGGNFRRSDLKAAIDLLRERLQEVEGKLAEIMNSQAHALLTFANAHGLWAAQAKYARHLEESVHQATAKLGMTKAAGHNAQKSIERLTIEIEALRGKRALGIDIVEYKDDDKPDFIYFPEAISDMEEVDPNDPIVGFKPEEDDGQQVGRGYTGVDLDPDAVTDAVDWDDDDNTGDWEQAGDEDEDGDAD